MIGEFFLIKRKIKRYLVDIFNNDKDTILDLGCGEKPSYHEFIKGKIVCCDIVKNKIAHVVGDADNLPFKENSFDKIISINSFYYFKNPFSVAKDLHKILKKNGKIILVVPFFYPIHDIPFDRYRFTKYGLRTMLEKHFRVDEIKTIGGFFNMPAIILHSFIKGLPLMFPKSMRNFIKIIAYVLYPLYITAQLVSILDIFDKTDRFPTYYFVVASKTF